MFRARWEPSYDIFVPQAAIFDSRPLFPVRCREKDMGRQKMVLQQVQSEL
jgi:hypothetical protein